MNTKNKNANPKISVIITCYNYGKFIDEAIQSIENQTFKDYEIIIIDDCSTDIFTKNRIEELLFYNQPYENDVLSSKCPYKKISNIIQLKKNIGVSQARNLGAKKAKGKYIIFLDGDDKLRYDCLERMYNKITTDEFDIISCLVETFGIENKKQKKINSTLHNFVWNCTIHISFLHKKRDFDKVKGFDSSFIEGSEEFDLFQRLMNIGKKPFIIQDYLLLYRKHKNSRSDFIILNKKKDRELRLKLIVNSPKLYHTYIESIRYSLRKEKKITRKLLIIIVLLTSSHIFYLF